MALWWLYHLIPSIGLLLFGVAILLAPHFTSIDPADGEYQKAARIVNYILGAMAVLAFLTYTLPKRLRLDRSIRWPDDPS